MSITSQNNVEKILEYARSYHQKWPGFYLTSLQLGDLYGALENPPEDPLTYYLRAYLLSGKDELIYRYMEGYMYRENRIQEIQEINRQYGEPNKTNLL